MAKLPFESEAKMQEWLSNKLHNNSCFKDLIINLIEFEDIKTESLAEQKILDCYKNCLKSLDIVNIITENENISLKEGDSLKPDFLLYAPETETIVIIELKNLGGPSRQTGTEVSAYTSEVKSYIPFISDGDIISIIISPVWTTLLRHYIFHEIFWLQRNILCLEPIISNDEYYLEIKDINTLLEDNVSLNLSHEHLGGYQICLYDLELYNNPDNRTRLEPYIEQMKTAIASMASTGNSQKNHGFAFLWKENWSLSLAPFSITVLNFAPFESLERLFHENDFKPNEITEKIIDSIIKENNPIGHGNSLEEITNNGIRFLENFCEPRREGFCKWDVLRANMTNLSKLISFHAWGIFAELYSDKLFMEYEKGNIKISSTDPDLGLELIDGLIDPNYEFINLIYYNDNPDDIMDGELF